MVQDTGKALCPDSSLRRVNLPEPVIVEENPSGEPAAVAISQIQNARFEIRDKGKNFNSAVASIEDRWRIDDEWWRSEPVSRLYYSVRLASGQRLVIYRDLISGRWYKQTY